LLFLHSRPEPIVHRDLKPENILLDQNFVSKVSDVGIAKLVPSNNMTFSVTMYKETRLMGTMAYIDPDYQRTGIISCESDVYALGVVMLQILSGRPAVGVTELVENAMDNNSFHEVLDESAGDWPLEKAMELACLALECTEPRRRNRPRLESKVLPILDKLRAHVDEEVASMAVAQGAGPVIPSFFFCPISQVSFFSFLFLPSILLSPPSLAFDDDILKSIHLSILISCRRVALLRLNWDGEFFTTGKRNEKGHEIFVWEKGE
jgi:serine/threonine protein kinase